MGSKHFSNIHTDGTQTSASSPHLMSCWGFSWARWHSDDYNTSVTDSVTCCL